MLDLKGIAHNAVGVAQRVLHIEASSHHLSCRKQNDVGFFSATQYCTHLQI